MKHWRLVYLIIPFTILFFATVAWANGKTVDEPCVGVGFALTPTHYTEGESPIPAWWDPDEEMAIEWTVTDIGCPDYDYDSTIYGWDGHTMQTWEMDIFSRIAYCECRGCSLECQKAVVDAILRLWESEYYSTTIYGTLSAVNDDGSYAYSPYPTMWEEEYDPDILEEMRELCEERFVNGPEYTAPFFRTKYYHEWAVPCYCFPGDNVYFSTGKGW